MKKLMIAAAVAVLGISVNAASYTWTAANSAYYVGVDSQYNEFDGYGVYLFDLNALSMTASDVTTSLAGGTDILESALASTSITEGYAYEMSSTALTLATGKGTPEYINALAVLVTSDEKFFTAQEINVKVTSAVESGGADLGAEFAMSALPASGAEGWTQVAPEPTSGLLLLVGVAGLALRRRRA